MEFKGSNAGQIASNSERAKTTGMGNSFTCPDGFDTNFQLMFAMLGWAQRKL